MIQSKGLRNFSTRKSSKFVFVIRNLTKHPYLPGCGDTVNLHAVPFPAAKCRDVDWGALESLAAQSGTVVGQRPSRYSSNSLATSRIKLLR